MKQSRFNSILSSIYQQLKEKIFNRFFLIKIILRLQHLHIANNKI